MNPATLVRAEKCRQTSALSNYWPTYQRIRPSYLYVEHPRNTYMHDGDDELNGFNLIEV